MKTYFRHFRFSMFGVALLCMVLGIALMLFPDLTQKVFCIAFGAVLLLCGIFQIASYVIGTNKNLLAKLMFAGGVVACVAGAAILLRPNQEIIWKLTLIVIGIVLIYHGVMDVKYAFDIRGCGGKCGAALIFGLLTAGVGVLVLVDPFADASIIFKVCAIGFIFDGLTDLYTVFTVASNEKRYELAAAEPAAPLPGTEETPAGDAAAEPETIEVPVAAEEAPSVPAEAVPETAAAEPEEPTV